MHGKTIVLGVTGGIAAYKAAELTRLLVKQGAQVHVVMSKGAEAFITPLTLQTLSGRPVGRNLLDLTEESQIGHIELADAADLILVAPATANAIARVAAGMADELLTAVILASRAPVMLAPAMNVNMWENPITQQNLNRLLATGRFSTVGPDRGELACGWIGAGRLLDPAEIVSAAASRLAVSSGRTLEGRKILVTAGPTREPVDGVRFLGNRSSGKMGFAIAESAARLGAEVKLIAGPVSLPTPAGVRDRIDVETAAELQSAVQAALPDVDVLVMAAAVADFRPSRPNNGKLSRRAAAPDTVAVLELTANPDILAAVGRSRSGGRPYLVGFAAEMGAAEHELADRALAKLKEKHCDAVVANDVGTPGVGFAGDDNAGVLVFPDGGTVTFPRSSKHEMAERLWAAIAPRLQ